MEFSTVELFQLNLICLNQIISVSSHKCLNWESNSVLINQGFLSILDNPRATERVPCTEYSPLHQERPLSLDIISIHMLPCLFLLELHMAEFYNIYLQWQFPFSMGPPYPEWLQESRAFCGTHHIHYLIQHVHEYIFTQSIKYSHYSSLS